MSIVFMGGEVPSNRLLLIESGVQNIGVSFWGLRKRGLPKSKTYLLSEKYPDDVKIYLTAGTAATTTLSTREAEEFAADYEDFIATNYHGIACAKPDNLRQVPLATASTLSWLSPMMRGETIVWDGNRLVRYQKKMKDQARPRYKSVIEKQG